MAGTLFALLAGFRSIAVALKAIALNLLSVGAALGALVLVFQEGHGSVLFGIDGGTGTVFSLVPIVTFAVVFGLSMDYEVFLVARVLEARRSGFSEIDAIVEGVAKTGGLITSAAAIMVVVFAGFAFGNVLVVKMLGFALAVAVHNRRDNRTDGNWTCTAACMRGLELVAMGFGGITTVAVVFRQLTPSIVRCGCQTEVGLHRRRSRSMQVDR